ncbi:CLUMA_CG006403, isoform A [Clunio marinus]|uniref:CLUMA_CG006403, isoform A n=1 Tax=Clunio marinus TaxID=568069 RepID=A0A1J1HXK8_9DIPT|nr:CLUMA_CG006403, isoform A [Clunio marinus]
MFINYQIHTDWISKVEFFKPSVEKNKLHKKVKNGDSLSIKNYENARKAFKELNCISYKLYVDKISEEIKENPKAFFNFVNHKKISDKFPANMSFQGLSVTGDKNVAAAFANFFKSVFNPESSGCCTEPPSRKNAGHLFLAGILDGSVESSEFLASLNFNTNMLKARSAPLFKSVSQHKTDYGRNNPLERLIREFKQIQHEFDFHLTKNNFKTNLVKNRN